MKVIIHIGPPKTATTSIQAALEKVVDSQFYYAGAFHPRQKNANSLGERIYNACKSDRTTEDEFGLIVREMRTLSRQHAVFFLSEEQFLVDLVPTSQLKFTQLRKLLAEFDCRIVLTLRRPDEALFSYYQQMFEIVFPLHVSGFSAFCRHRIASCYDYFSVCKKLHNIGFTDLCLIEFDRLIEGRSNLADITGCAELSHISLDLAHENKGGIGLSKAERVLPDVTLKSTLSRSATIMRLVRYSGARQLGVYKLATDVLDRIVWRRQQSKRLAVDPHILKALEASYDRAWAEFGRDHGSK